MYLDALSSNIHKIWSKWRKTVGLRAKRYKSGTICRALFHNVRGLPIKVGKIRKFFFTKLLLCVDTIHTKFNFNICSGSAVINFGHLKLQKVALCHCGVCIKTYRPFYSHPKRQFALVLKQSVRKLKCYKKGSRNTTKFL